MDMDMDARSLEAMRMPATYLRLLAREHPRPQQILTRFGVFESAPSDPDTISVAEFFALVRAVDSSRPDRGWHLDMARRTADHFHGPLTFALMSAPTIGDGVRAFARYVRIRVPYLRGATQQTGFKFKIEFAELGDFDDLRPVLLEIPFRILQDYVSMIGDVNLEAASLSLKYPSTRKRRYYRQGFDCPVLFEQSANVLTMPAAWMAIPNPQYDETTWLNARAQCEVALSDLTPTDTVTRTRVYVDAVLPRDPRKLCIDDAARNLGLSVRTLIRRLRKDGTSFQAVRDKARQDLALRLLRKPNLTVEEIALAVGFSGAANFSRAFKRWFGSSPVRYRREHIS